MPGKDPFLPRLAGVAGAAVGVLWRAFPALVAVGLLSFGAWLAWPPAGFMTAGALLLADTVVSRMASRGRSQ